MKIVQAYIRPHKLPAVSLALHQAPDISGMTALGAFGWGSGKLEAEKKHREEQVRDFEDYTKIEVCCPDAIAEQVIEVIREAAHTGLQGDGMIYVAVIEDAVRISTGETGEKACEGA